MEDKVEFLESVTNEERNMDWQKIVEISDADFGFDDIDEKKHKTRFGTRVILQDTDGEICMVKSEKYGYMQIPGGGIDDGETIIKGLCREVREETGYTIDDIEPLGYIVEYRESVRNNHPWDKCVSFVFKARPVKYLGTQYMEDEIAEGFVPIWMDIDELIFEFEKQDGKIESYSGNFSNRRDLSILKFYKKLSI